MLNQVIGEPAMLEQAAEESSELIFALLKLARFKRDENKVYNYTESELKDKVIEEAADVLICIDELVDMYGPSFESSMNTMYNKKRKRMAKRLKESEEQK